MAFIDIGDITNIATYVRQKYEEVAKDKIYINLDSQLNIQYIKGNQYLGFNAINKYTVDIIEIEGSDHKLVFNRMSKIHRERIKILLRNEPDPQCVAIKKTIESDKKAKITNSLIQKIKNDNNFKKLYKSFVTKLESQGFAFYKIIYDTKMDELLKLNIQRLKNENNIFGEMEKEKIANIVQKIHKGAVSIYVGGLYEFYPSNVRSNKVEDNDFIIHAKAFHVDDIKKAYGVTVKSENINKSMFQEQSKTSYAQNMDDTRTNQKQLDDYAMVIEYYEKPTYNSPNGRKIVVAGNELLSIADLPYRCGPDEEYSYNFVTCTQIPVDGYFFGHFIHTDLRPVQKRYNELRNILYEYANKVSIGQYMVGKGVLEDSSALTNEMARIIEINPMFGGIDLLPMGKMPPEIYNEINLTLNEMAALSGLQASSLNGDVPSNIRSGEQMDKISSSDENSVGITAANIVEATEELFTKCLRVYKQFTKKISMEIYENDGLDKLIVTSANILDNVKVVNKGIIGLTEKQMQVKLTQAIQLGLLNKEGTNPYGDVNTKIILDNLGLGHLDIDNEARYEEEVSNYENNNMVKSSNPIQINDFDVDELHIKYHERMLKTSEFRRMLKLDPNGATKYENILAHIDQHKKRLSKAQLKQQLLASIQK